MRGEKGMAGVKECVRCGSTRRLRPVTFKVYGTTAVWEDSTIYCSSCIKDLGWVEVVE
jgi:Zn ribbon nucleic-acid-binding protein